MTVLTFSASMSFVLEGSGGLLVRDEVWRRWFELPGCFKVVPALWWVNKVWQDLLVSTTTLIIKTIPARVFHYMDKSLLGSVGCVEFPANISPEF